MTKLLILATLTALLAACDKKPCECSEVPPPIALGKCVPEHFVGHNTVNETCVYLNYSWTCRAMVGYDSLVHCVRGAETKAEHP